MSEETAAAAATSAAPVMEVERGPLVNLSSDQRREFRRTGELPEAPKTEAPAASHAEETPSSEEPGAEAQGKAETPKNGQEKQGQGKRKPGAEARIGELTAANKRLMAELDELKKGAAKPAAETPKAEAAKPAEAPKTETPKVEQPKAEPTRPKPTAEDKDADGKPKYATYEDYIEDLTDWKAEQRDANSQRARQLQAEREAMQGSIDAAKSRYGAEKFDQVLVPTVNTILSDQAVPPVVRAVLNESDVLPHLIYTLGSDPNELATFLNLAKTQPGKALRYIALTESLIREELEGGAAGAAKPAGEGAGSETPAKPKTNAPPPPAVVGGRAAAPGDALEAAAKAKDFRAYKQEADRRSLARLKS